MCDFNDFCNPEIPGLGRCQSRDSGLAKTARILGYRDPAIAIPTHDYQQLFIPLCSLVCLPHTGRAASDN